MLTGDVKSRLIAVLTELIERHRKARAAVTDEVMGELTGCCCLQSSRFMWTNMCSSLMVDRGPVYECPALAQHVRCLIPQS